MPEDSNGTNLHPPIEHEPKAESRKVKVRRLAISANRAPENVYKSREEVEKALADGNFDVKRTQFVKDGRLFFMTYV